MNMFDGPWGFILLGLALLGLLVYVLPALGRLPRLESQVRRQGEAVNQLCERLGIDPIARDPLGTLDAQERSLIAQGKKIEAIRHHRARTGSSLKEARDAVERGGA